MDDIEASEKWMERLREIQADTLKPIDVEKLMIDTRDFFESGNFSASNAVGRLYADVMVLAVGYNKLLDRVNELESGLEDTDK